MSIGYTSHNHQNKYFCAERRKDIVRGATSAAQGSRNLCPRDVLWKIRREHCIFDVEFPCYLRAFTLAP
jgi:hypothetical protein